MLAWDALSSLALSEIDDETVPADVLAELVSDSTRDLIYLVELELFQRVGVDPELAGLGFDPLAADGGAERLGATACARFDRGGQLGLPVGESAGGHDTASRPRYSASVLALAWR